MFRWRRPLMSLSDLGDSLPFPEACLLPPQGRIPAAAADWSQGESFLCLDGRSPAAAFIVRKKETPFFLFLIKSGTEASFYLVFLSSICSYQSLTSLSLYSV